MNLIRTTYSIDGREITVGVRIPRLLQGSRFDFKIDSECVSEDPYLWTATVRFGHIALFTTTDRYPDPDQAGAAAESELERRVAHLLGDNGDIN
jgi:hypothetical protein